MADFQLETGFQVDCAVNVLDVNGQVIPGVVLDAGSGSVSTSDSTLLTATISADETTVTIVTVGPEATDVVVSLSGTVDGVPLDGQLAVDVTGSPVAGQVPTSLGLVPGTPVPIETPPAA